MADVNQLFSKANQLYQKGRLSDAKKAFQKVLKKSPKFTDALNMYGVTLAQLGESQLAVQQFLKILNVDPKKATAYENLGRVYNQLHKFTEARNIFEKLTQLDPSSYPAYFGLGGALMSLNNYIGALDAFEKAEKINATQQFLFINIGTVYTQLGKTNEAISSFNKAIQMDKTSAPVYLRLGQLYINNNDYTLAEDALKKAYALQNDDFDINLSLADAYQHNLDDVAALKHYLLADKFKPESQNVYTKLDKLILHSGSEDKLNLLEQLTEGNEYNDWNHALTIAKKLVRLTEYHESKTLSALHQFIDEYQPERLYSREWWQSQLELFGDKSLGHDKTLRGIHSAVFSWSIPDETTLASIAEFAKGTRLYSYGAGSALWERLLSDHFGILVTATDFSPRHSFLPIEAEDYAKSFIPETDTIFLAWIIRGDKAIFNILSQIKPGQKLVLIGEPPDEQGIPRICGTPEMFDLLKSEFTLGQAIPLVSYSMLNDTVSLYTKN